MGANSKIAWTDHTFNPWWGCTKVSPGCQNCYAETLAHRYLFDVWGPGKARRITSNLYWRQPIRWNRVAEKVIGRPSRVFCGSMCDVFEHQPDNPAYLGDLRWRLYDLIAETPWLTWLLLTKRTENVLDLVPELWKLPGRWPANVWIGTTIENQECFDRRIPELLKIPAAVRFLSCEPLLGPLDISGRTLLQEVIDNMKYVPTFTGRLIDWVICGGESGPHARPMHPDWARSLRNQCRDAGIPFFFKQWGEWLPDDQLDPSNRRDPLLDGSMSWVKLGKEKSGHLLDGRLWDQLPTLARVIEPSSGSGGAIIQHPPFDANAGDQPHA